MRPSASNPSDAIAQQKTPNIEQDVDKLTMDRGSATDQMEQTLQYLRIKSDHLRRNCIASQVRDINDWIHFTIESYGIGEELYWNFSCGTI